MKSSMSHLFIKVWLEFVRRLGCWSKVANMHCMVSIRVIDYSHLISKPDCAKEQIRWPYKFNYTLSFGLTKPLISC